MCAFGRHLKGQALEESAKADTRSQLRAYVLFCDKYDVTPFPVIPVIYRAYIAFLFNSLTSANSVLIFLNALRHANLELGYDVAFMYDYDSLLLKRAAKKILGVNQHRKEEVSVDMLRRIVGCLDDCILLHCSMKALFLVAFFSFLRKSNLLFTCARDGSQNRPNMFLKRENVSFTHDGALLKVYRTKTLLLKSKLFTIPIPRIPGSICVQFQPCSKYLSCHPGSPGDPLCMLSGSKGSVKPDTTETATAFLKECISFIGLDRSSFPMHSFRRGSRCIIRF